MSGNWLNHTPWGTKFMADLDRLGLDRRHRNVLVRMMWMSESAEIFRRNGQLLDFDEWVLVAHERRDMLEKGRGIGRKTADVILVAVDRYLSESKVE